MPVRAQVRLRGGVAAASRTDLCEQLDGPPVPVGDGVAEPELPPSAWSHWCCRPTQPQLPDLTAPAAPASAPAPAAAPGPEPGPPVFTRYWLHGRGPAPAGNLPVAVHLSPARTALQQAGQAASLRLTVACGTAPAAGQVRLAVPAGLTVDPPGPVGYDLPARGQAGWDLAVRARPGARPGRYYLAAQIGDPAGPAAADAWPRTRCS